jgi:ATP-dependent Lon protease
MSNHNPTNDSNFSKLQQWGDELVGKDPVDYGISKDLEEAYDEIVAKNKRTMLIDKEKYLLSEHLKNLSKSSSEYARVKLRLEYLQKLPWDNVAFKQINVEDAERIMNASHYGMDEVKKEIIDSLHAMNRARNFNSSVLLLSGPPGTGKTTIARQIAKSIGRPLHKISLGGLDDDIFLKGSSIQYASSRPGALMDILFKEGHKELVILLDEVDKLSIKSGQNNGAAALLDALDQDNEFLDRFVNIPFDFKGIIFIATANEPERIAPALYDRMQSIEIRPYHQEEKVEIATRFLLPREMKKCGLSEDQLSVDQEVIAKLVEEDANSGGLRTLTRKINRLCTHSAGVLNKPDVSSVTITESLAEDIGVINAQSQIEWIAKEIDRPGIVQTASYNPKKGCVQYGFVEATLMEGERPASVIGVQNDYLKSLVELSYVVISSAKKSLGLPTTAFNKMYPVVKTYNPMTPSGIELGILVAMYSKASAIKLPTNHLVLGKLSLFGNIYSDKKVETVFTKALESDLELIIAPKDLKYKLDLEERKYPDICWVDEVAELNSAFALLQDLNVINKFVFNNATTYSLKFLEPHIKKIRALAKSEGISFRMAMKRHLELDETNTKDEGLDQLIGLGTIKQRVIEMVKYKEMCVKRKHAGYPTKDISMHMAFYGNPGTGKTTVAKILGKLLYSKNLVSSNKFVEVCREDLVGRYIGHTEERVASVLEKAKGGILYIDEAHSLFVNSSNDFGRIAISTLVKGIEEQREDTVLILSGYKNEMKEMIHSNVGLEQRIGLHVDFEDYSLDELVQIFESLCNAERYQLREACGNQLESYFQSVMDNKSETFGNGRFVRNFFEKVKVMQSMRITEYETLTEEDFEYFEVDDLDRAIQAIKANVKGQVPQRRIGFNTVEAASAQL